MFKILLLALGIWLLVTILKSYRRNVDSAAATERQGDIVQCASCGVHVPTTEALRGQDGVYCSEACRSKHQDNGS